MVAGRRGRRPASLSPSKAWGDVTSWTSWRSIYSRVVPSGSSRTTWDSQILANNVSPAMQTPSDLTLSGQRKRAKAATLYLRAVGAVQGRQTGPWFLQCVHRRDTERREDSGN